ncbi:hypothetical protein HA402_012518 [Bradysia odoriphaga]|nr:hypothetical protein HA402_012518 [Bradysia odoriphaga]
MLNNGLKIEVKTLITWNETCVHIIRTRNRCNGLNRCNIFGKNFPWRGRQTICNQNSTKIENETLQKISSAVTVSDFHKLFIQTHHLPFYTDSACISNEKHSYNNPLTCHIEKAKVLSNRKPVTSTVHLTNNHRNRKGKTRYNITTKVGGNETFDDETENLEWYIELASRCYNEGFQWHMNYLNDCTRRSALLKRRRLTGTVSKSTAQCVSPQHQVHLAGNEIDQQIPNDDRFRDDVSDCKIRININQSLNSNSNHTKTINNNTNSRKRSNYSSVAHLNKKINIMNSSGYSFDAINVQNDMKTDRLNDVLDNFGSLNISCGSVLPQIVLSDFSSIDSMPRTHTLLLTPTEQYSISGTKSQSQAECLSTPAEHYRYETRPC